MILLVAMTTAYIDNLLPLWDNTVSNNDIPYEVRICRYPRGTAESLAIDLGAMLTELAGK